MKIGNVSKEFSRVQHIKKIGEDVCSCGETHRAQASGPCAICGKQLGHYDTKLIDQDSDKIYCANHFKCFSSHPNDGRLELTDNFSYYNDG